MFPGLIKYSFYGCHIDIWLQHHWHLLKLAGLRMLYNKQCYENENQT